MLQPHLFSVCAARQTSDLPHPADEVEHLYSVLTHSNNTQRLTHICTHWIVWSWDYKWLSLSDHQEPQSHDVGVVQLSK